MLIYLVFSSKGEICFVCHELEVLKKFLTANKHYAVEVWNAVKGKRVGGGLPVAAGPQ